jgi:hypothetical protein
MLWRTFSVLVMFFAKIEEIIQLMVVMGVLNDEVGKIFNINARES